MIELQNDVWVPKSIELMPQAEYYVHLWCDWFNDEKNLNFEENPYSGNYDIVVEYKISNECVNKGNIGAIK